jgi:microcystin-dependent protein
MISTGGYGLTVTAAHSNSIVRGNVDLPQSGLSSVTTATAGGGNPHNNMPPYGSVNWIIAW